MRQRYESQQDLQNEREVLNALCIEVFPATHFSKCTSETLDFISSNAALEIKRRNGPASRYPEYFIAKQKVTRALDFKRATGIDVFLFWAWDDFIAGIELRHDQHFREAFGGRTVQTRDEWDVEQMIYIPQAACFFVDYAGRIQ